MTTGLHFKSSLNILAYAAQHVVISDLKGVYVGLKKVPNATRIPFEKIKQHFCPYIEVSLIQNLFQKWSLECLASIATGELDGFPATISETKRVLSFFEDKNSNMKISHTIQWDQRPELVFAAQLAHEQLNNKNLAQVFLSKINYLFMKVDPTSFYNTKHPFVRARNLVFVTNNARNQVKLHFNHVFGQSL